MQKKELYESNHLIRWGITVGIFVCLVLIVLIVSMDFAFLNQRLVTRNGYLKFFLIVLAVFFTALICRRFICFLADYLNHTFLKRFHEIKILGTYEEARPKILNHDRKIKHIVLLLHGFTTVPEQLGSLINSLSKANIPYYAPNMLGFGLNSTQLLETVRCEDWFRIALDHFDVLQQFAEEISIVGHSMGGNLATFIAEHRRVKHLILSAPAFCSVSRDLFYKKILFTPGLSSLYSWVFPFLPKSVHNGRKTVSDTLDNSIAAKTFHYLAVPVNCIREFFRSQGLVDLTKTHFTSLTLLYGKQDITIDTPKYLAKLRQTDMQFTEQYFENSAHNIFEDYDREKVCARILEILTS